MLAPTTTFIVVLGCQGWVLFVRHFTGFCTHRRGAFARTKCSFYLTFGPLPRSYKVLVDSEYALDLVEANKVRVDHAKQRKAKVACLLCLKGANKLPANATISCKRQL